MDTEFLHLVDPELRTSPGRCAPCMKDWPGILHLHGGGFNAGSARSGLPMLQELAELGCPAVTAECRLAPETPYSGAMMDGYAALGWMHANAGRIGLNPDRFS